MINQAYHLAQVNIARMLAPLDDPIMAEFVAALDEVNRLADESPGFVWRLQTDDGNATTLRPYDDERILFNMSVWESVEELHQYVYRTQHAKVMVKRKQWFSRFGGIYYALWWIPAGHIPSIAEAKQRLEHLEQHGETPLAFHFRHPFPPPVGLALA
ncbi:MAG: DUF3291 domain-containing protein [Anaerolineae bacterium]